MVRGVGGLGSIKICDRYLASASEVENGKSKRSVVCGMGGGKLSDTGENQTEAIKTFHG